MPQTNEETATTALVAKLALIEILDPTFAEELGKRADAKMTLLGIALTEHETEVLVGARLDPVVAMRSKALKLANDPNRKIPGMTDAESDQVRRLGLNPATALRALRRIKATSAPAEAGSATLPQPLPLR
jgi:hypothetical protein